MINTDFLTNKYFVAGLIIVLIIVIIICYRKDSCSRENMSILSSITEKPWTDDTVGSEYRQISNDKEKSDEDEEKSDEEESESEEEEKETNIDILYKKYKELKNRKKKSAKKNNEYPKPLDTNPEFGNCQPCICPK